MPTRKHVAPRLGDLELGFTDAVPVADADLGVGKAVDGEVLAELAVVEVVAPQVLLPIAVGLDLVDHDGPMLAAVPDRIALAVAVHLPASHPARAGYGTFPDAGVDGPALPRHVLR
jgi:hypothetical protein